MFGGEDNLVDVVDVAWPKSAPQFVDAKNVTEMRLHDSLVWPLGGERVKRVMRSGSRDNIPDNCP